jgi:hypothetical protein
MLDDVQDGLKALFTELDQFDKIVKEKNLLPDKAKEMRAYMTAKKQHTYV